MPVKLQKIKNFYCSTNKGNVNKGVHKQLQFAYITDGTIRHYWLPQRSLPLIPCYVKFNKFISSFSTGCIRTVHSYFHWRNLGQCIVYPTERRFTEKCIYAIRMESEYCMQNIGSGSAYDSYIWMTRSLQLSEACSIAFVLDVIKFLRVYMGIKLQFDWSKL